MSGAEEIAETTEIQVIGTGVLNGTRGKREKQERGGGFWSGAQSGKLVSGSDAMSVLVYCHS
jgi:hypothetical protein